MVRPDGGPDDVDLLLLELDDDARVVSNDDIMLGDGVYIRVDDDDDAGDGVDDMCNSCDRLMAATAIILPSSGIDDAHRPLVPQLRFRVIASYMTAASHDEFRFTLITARSCASLSAADVSFIDVTRRSCFNIL